MYKKFVQSFSLFVFVFAIISFSFFVKNSNVYATSTESGYNPPTLVSELNFSVVLNNGKVDMKWSSYAPEGFNYYKVIRSSTNQNPVYPEDGYIEYSSDVNFTSYTDSNILDGTSYYRVCSIANPNRYCSNVVTIINNSNEIIEAVPTLYTTTETTAETSKEFSDTSSSVYKVAIEYLKDNNIVQGYNDGTFKPNNTINRAEFMKIVIASKYSDLISNTDSNCFYDVKNEWYSPYICLGKKKGIVGGYPDGTFKPSQNISFAEASKIISEAYGLNVTKTSLWYEGYVKFLEENKYIPQTVNTITKNITRSEMAELIWRVIEQKKDQSSIDLLSNTIITNSDEKNGWTTYTGSGFSFKHPNWYKGVKWGWDLLTDEKDFIDNINVSNYMDVDSYLSVYTVSGSNLETSLYFAHPLVSSTNLNINGVEALKRHFRAPRGTVVNGRTTGENENITVYTYKLDGKVVVLQYFNAFGTENYNVETFYEIAESFTRN